MKRLVGTFLAVVLLLGVASVALAATPTAPGKNPLTCFGTPDGCVLVGKTSATITNRDGNVGGVYYVNANNSFYGVRLSAVTTLSNTVSGDELGIDPRWSIPIDENNDGYTEAFAFVSFADCNNGAGLVDVINDPTCVINYKGVAYPNWYTFAHTDGTNFEISALDNYAFIIADGSGAPGTWTVSNVKVGKPGK